MKRRKRRDRIEGGVPKVMIDAEAVTSPSENRPENFSDDGLGESFAENSALDPIPTLETVGFPDQSSPVAISQAPTEPPIAQLIGKRQPTEGRMLGALEGAYPEPLPTEETTMPSVSLSKDEPSGLWRLTTWIPHKSTWAQIVEFWRNHDIIVWVMATIFLFAGTILHLHDSAPTLVQFDQFGLEMMRPGDWLAPVSVESKPSRFFPEDKPKSKTGGLPFHQIYTSPTDAETQLEIEIDNDANGASVRLDSAIGLVLLYGDSVWTKAEQDKTISGRDWLRTEFQYARKSSDSDTPHLITGVRYSLRNDAWQYHVTLHGSLPAVRRLENLLTPTFKINPEDPARKLLESP